MAKGNDQASSSLQSVASLIPTRQSGNGGGGGQKQGSSPSSGSQQKSSGAQGSQGSRNYDSIRQNINLVPRRQYLSGNASKDRKAAERGDSALANIAYYLTSGKTNLADTKRYIAEATELSQRWGGTGKNFDASTQRYSTFWSNIANELKGNLFNDYQNEISNLKMAQAERGRQRQTAQNMSRSAEANARALGGVDEWGNQVTDNIHTQNWNYWDRKVKEYDEQDAIDNAKLTALQEEMFQAFLTPELQAALMRKTENRYDFYNQTTATGERDPNVPDYWIGDFTPESDQALLDAYRESLGLNQKFYNNADKAMATASGTWQGIKGAFAGMIGTLEKAEGGQEALIGSKYDLNGDWVITDEEREEYERQERAKTSRKVGALNVDDYLPSDIEKLRQTAADTPFFPEAEPEKAAAAQQAQAQLEAGAISWGKNADAMQAQYDENEKWMQDYDRAVGATMDEATIAELDAEYDRRFAENAQLKKDIAEAREIAKQYGGGRASLAYMYKHGTSEDIARAYDQLSWELISSGDAKIAKAKEGTGVVGRTLIDMGKTGMEMGFDAVAGAITGGGGLPIMFMRVFGRSSQEARVRGASVDEQVFYGMTVAGIEVFTEKLADLGGGIIYGKSFTGDFSKQLIHNLKLSPVWEMAMYAVADAVGEGLEEGAADFMGGLAEIIIARNKDLSWWEDLKGKTDEQCANILSDVILGGLMGLIGAGGGAITGQYAGELAELYHGELDADFAERRKVEGLKNTQAAFDQMLANGTEFTPNDVAAYNDFEAAYNKAEAEAKNNPRKEAGITKAFDRLTNIIEKRKAGQEVKPEELLTKQEADMLAAIGMMPRDQRASYTQTSKRDTAKAQRIVEKSQGKASTVREQIIDNAEREGVKIYSDSIPGTPTEGNQNESDLPPMPDGPQSSQEYTAEQKAKAAEEKAAIKAGETDNKKLVEVAKMVDTYVGSGKTVKNITENIFAKTGEEGEASLLDKVTEWMERKIGGRIFTKKINGGIDVILNRRGIKNDIAHKVGEEKAATFQALPDILREGRVVSTTKENGQAVSYIIAGKVNLMGKPVNVYCLIKKDGSGENRFYLHEVSDGNGNLFYQLNEDGTLKEGQKESAPPAFQDPSSVQTPSAEEALPENSIPQEGSTGNNENGTIEESEGGVIDGGREDQTEGGTSPTFGDRARKGKGDAGRVREEPGEREKVPRVGEKTQAGRILTRNGRVNLSGVCSKYGLDTRKILPSESKSKALLSLEDVVDGPISTAIGGDGTVGGVSDYSEETGKDSYNILLILNEKTAKSFGNIAAHEVGHRKTLYYEQSEASGGVKYDSGNAIRAALSEVPGTDAEKQSAYNSIIGAAKQAWARDYLSGVLSEAEIAEIESLPVSEVNLKVREMLSKKDKPGHEGTLASVYGYFFMQETANEFLARNYEHFSETGLDLSVLDAMSNVVQQKYVDDGVFTPEEMFALNEAITILNKEGPSLLSEYENFSGTDLIEEEFNDTKAEFSSDAPGTNDAPSRVSELESENEALKKRIAELEGQQGQEAPAEQRAMPSGVEKKSDNALRDKTQTRPAAEDMDQRAKDTAEKFGVSDGTYLSYTRDEVSRIADFWIEKYGAENEKNRLLQSRDWNRVDFSVAGKLAYEMTIELNRDMLNGSHGLGPILERKNGETEQEYKARQKAADDAEYNRRRDEINSLLQAYGEQKSVAGQKLQEQYKFSVADEIRMRASKRFLSYSENGEVHNTEYAVNAKLWNVVDDLLTQMEAAEEAGDTKAMIELTKKVSRIRSRQNMFGKAGVWAENFMFERMMEGGLDADKLSALAYGNINKIMDDITPISYADAIESVRMSNMLSNVATGLNNLLNNAAALRNGALAQNAAIPFAKAFEKLTGKKIAVSDSSFFRAGHLRVEEVAFEYAVMSAYYGINAEDGRLDVRGTGGQFSVMGTGASGFVERALARYNFLVNALVLSPDAPAKARVQAGIQKGIDKVFDGTDLNDRSVAANKRELEAYARHEAQRRTLQDDNKFTNAVLYVKKHLLGSAKTPGEHTVIRGRELGSFDLGQFMIAFAKVPTNVGVQKVMATPYGAAYQVARYAYGLAKAKSNPESMSVMEMAKLSRDVGRAATTAGMVALGAFAAACGVLKNFDDTDDDEEKKLAAEKGYSGLMFNVSAMFRKGNEWKNDDLVISGNFLEILATPLAIGAIMYDAKSEGIGTLQAINKGTAESFVGMMDAILDIPGLSQVGDLYQSFANRNPDEDDFTGAMKALGQYATSTGTSYVIPNLLAQATAGLDNKHREIYKTNSYAQTLRNIWMAKIPGLRQMLPEKVDSLGNTRTYGDSGVMAVINTVLLPGDIRRYHVSELEVEMLRLKREGGYSGTWFDVNAPKKIEVGGSAYALNADQQMAFKSAKAKRLVEAYDAFRTSEVYKSMTDAQRIEVYKALRLDAERITKNEALELAGVEDRVTMDKWEETLTSTKDKITYLSAKQLGASLWDDENKTVANYADMDSYIKTVYPSLTKEMKDLLDNSLTHLDDIYSASKVGIDSKTWSALNEVHSKYMDLQDYYRDADLTDEPSQTALARDMIVEFEDIVKDPKQREWAQSSMKLWMTIPVNTETLEKWQRNTSLATKEIDGWMDTKESAPIKGGYKSLSQNQRFMMVRDFDGITASNQAELEAKRWDMIEREASESAWGKLKPYKDAGKTVAYALDHASYWYKDGRRWVRRQYNRIYAKE